MSYALFQLQARKAETEARQAQAKVLLMIEGPLPENVAIFPGATEEDYDPNVVLAAAQRANLESVFVVGWTQDGELFASASIANCGDLLWLMEVAKAKMMRAVLENND